jgi:phage protein D
MTNNGSSSAVENAAPTIVLGEQDSTSLTAGLINLFIVETVDGLYRCEANIGNWGEQNGSTGYLYFDRQTLDFGKHWQVRLGPQGSGGLIFDGRITGLEAQFPNGQPPYITILAEDRLQDLRMTRRTRSFENVSDSDVINRIANDHGLRPDVQVSGPTYRVLAQVNESDLAFLRERARCIDAELWMEGDTLHASSRSRRASGRLSLTYHDNLREFSALADLANQRTSLAIGGWDVSAKQALQHQADDTILQSELNGTNSGASVLRQALGERKEMVVHTVPLSSAEARATAEALYRRVSRQFVTGRGVVDSQSALRVGSTLELEGLGPLFNGSYTLTEVKHLFDRQRGMRTEIKVERAGLGRP